MNTGWLLLLIPGLIWGASFLFIAEGLKALHPNGITFLRIAIGFVTLAFFPAARRPIERADYKTVALLGVIWFAFPLSMFPFAERHVTSALTGMLNGANPLFATIIAALIARRLPSRGVVNGLAVGIAGTILIALPAMSEGSSTIAGIAMILSAVLCYGLALNVARPLQLKYGGEPVIWRAQAVGLVLTAPLGAPELAHIQWKLWPLLSIAALGALGTGVAYVVIAMAAGRLGAARASSMAFLIPVVALVLGVTIRNESVAPMSVVGCVVCLAGAALMKRAAA